jgi:endonuclease YncB( thermonuclease family)
VNPYDEPLEQSNYKSGYKLPELEDRLNEVEQQSRQHSVYFVLALIFGFLILVIIIAILFRNANITYVSQPVLIAIPTEMLAGPESSLNNVSGKSSGMSLVDRDTNPSSTLSTGLTSSVEAIDCIPTDTPRSLGKVINVLDGSVIEVEINGKIQQVRYIGVSTDINPADNADWKTKAAADENLRLTAGQYVTLIQDTSGQDDDGRLLRYVLTDKLFVNNELIKNGFARAESVSPDLACQQTFIDSERRARENELIIWKTTPTITPTATRTRRPQPPTETPRPTRTPRSTPTIEPSAAAQ